MPKQISKSWYSLKKKVSKFDCLYPSAQVLCIAFLDNGIVLEGGASIKKNIQKILKHYKKILKEFPVIPDSVLGSDVPYHVTPTTEDTSNTGEQEKDGSDKTSPIPGRETIPGIKEEPIPTEDMQIHGPSKSCPGSKEGPTADNDINITQTVSGEGKSSHGTSLDSELGSTSQNENVNIKFTNSGEHGSVASISYFSSLSTCNSPAKSKNVVKERSTDEMKPLYVTKSNEIQNIGQRIDDILASNAKLINLSSQVNKTTLHKDNLANLKLVVKNSDGTTSSYPLNTLQLVDNVKTNEQSSSPSNSITPAKSLAGPSQLNVKTVKQMSSISNSEVAHSQGHVKIVKQKAITPAKTLAAPSHINVKIVEQSSALSNSTTLAKTVAAPSNVNVKMVNSSKTVTSTCKTPVKILPAPSRVNVKIVEPSLSIPNSVTQPKILAVPTKVAEKTVKEISSLSTPAKTLAASSLDMIMDDQSSSLSNSGTPAKAIAFTSHDIGKTVQNLGLSLSSSPLKDTTADGSDDVLQDFNLDLLATEPSSAIIKENYKKFVASRSTKTSLDDHTEDNDDGDDSMDVAEEVDETLMSEQQDNLPSHILDHRSYFRSPDKTPGKGKVEMIKNNAGKNSKNVSFTLKFVNSENQMHEHRFQTSDLNSIEKTEVSEDRDVDNSNRGKQTPKDGVKCIVTNMGGQTFQSKRPEFVLNLTKDKHSRLSKVQKPYSVVNIPKNKDGFNQQKQKISHGNIFIQSKQTPTVYSKNNLNQILVKNLLSYKTNPKAKNNVMPNQKPEDKQVRCDKPANQMTSTKVKLLPQQDVKDQPSNQSVVVQQTTGIANQTTKQFLGNQLPNQIPAVKMPPNQMLIIRQPTGGQPSNIHVPISDVKVPANQQAQKVKVNHPTNHLQVVQQVRGQQPAKHLTGNHIITSQLKGQIVKTIIIPPINIDQQNPIPPICIEQVSPNKVIDNKSTKMDDSSRKENTNPMKSLPGLGPNTYFILNNTSLPIGNAVKMIKNSVGKSCVGSIGQLMPEHSGLDFTPVKEEVITSDHNLQKGKKKIKLKSGLKVKVTRPQAKNWLCRDCGKYLPTRRKRVEHRKLFHPVQEKKVKTFDCTECEMKFQSKRKYKKHVFSHIVHKCEECDKIFKNRTNLQSHMRIHCFERPHLCDVCGKAFKTVTTLRLHSAVHMEKRELICEVCGDDFKHKAALNYHIKTHNPDTPFQCNVCDKKFKFKRQIKEHMYGHTGNYPHICEICAKGFARNDNLQRHLLTTHGDGTHKRVSKRAARSYDDTQVTISTENMNTTATDMFHSLFW